jgi:hypothetical protein
MNANQTVNVWDVKAMQEKLNDVIDMMFAAGLDEDARAMLRAFDKVIDKAVD